MAKLVTDRGRRAMRYALEEAYRLHSAALTPTHMVLGAILAMEEAAGGGLAALGVDLRNLRADLEAESKAGAVLADGADPEPSAEYWLALQAAHDSIGGAEVSAEQFLAGAVQAAGGVLAEILRAHGLTQAVVRASPGGRPV